MKYVALLILLALAPTPLLTAANAHQSDKDTEKERLKRPAEITISAPAAKIRGIFLTEYGRHGWQLDKESANSLTFTTRGGVGAALAYGRGSKLEDIVTLIESDNSTLVMIDCGALSPRTGGHFERFNINSDKKGRRLTEALLARVKEQVEKGAGPETDSPATAKPAPAPKPQPKTGFDNGRKVPCP